MHLLIVRYSKIQSHPATKNTSLNIMCLLAHQLAFLHNLDLTSLKGHLNLRKAFILEVHIDASCESSQHLQQETNPSSLRHLSPKFCVQQVPATKKTWSPQLISKQIAEFSNESKLANNTTRQFHHQP